MSLSWFIARRYLTARRRQAFISVISAVSIAGVGVGVAALIIALALMTGVQRELRDRIVGSTAHVYVYKIDGQLDVSKDLGRMKTSGMDIVGVAPALTGQGMMQSARSDGAAVQVKGIDPLLEPRVTDIGSALILGTLDALAHRPPDARDGVILGVDLAHTLGVTLGDPVTLITPRAVLTPGRAIPLQRFYQVVGIARFGYFETDSSAAFITLDSAARALGKDGPDLIQIRLSDMNNAPRVRERLQEQLGADYQVQDWIQLNGPLYSALWLEKVSISLTIGLIVIVAALNIVASLVLLVMEKSQDIAILRTMGTSARAVRRIFLLQGLTIGLIGTLTGTALGLAICYVAERYKLIKLPADVYQITYLPFRVEPLDVVIVVVSAVLVCVAATVYPARQAGRLDPAEALRNQ
jgi:lipoprotein-releasing system permease protein